MKEGYQIYIDDHIPLKWWQVWKGRHVQGPWWKFWRSRYIPRYIVRNITYVNHLSGVITVDKEF